ncbi:ammonium transporter [Methyloversatilis thermotolerans]|uniref:ammonium transporter n=1 Tax=Methyloversatilis thermotolerans TaxID=1346290 RepID=UPI0018DED088|nr:ammonium transporter [Methyloversatilis thermotolerans]
MSIASQVTGTLAGIVFALVGGGVIYGTIKALAGLRPDPEEEYEGADLAIHRIGASPERETLW